MNTPVSLPPIVKLFALCFGMALLCSNARAVEAEVRSIKTNQVRPVNATTTWLEIVVEVNLKALGEPSGFNPRFGDKVKVTLSSGYEVILGANKRIEYYKADAEAVTLEVEHPAYFRFYIPPEIIARDTVSMDKLFIAAEVTINGKTQKVGRNNYSPTLTTPEIAKSFLAKVAAESGPNDGIMVAQYFSPFVADYLRDAPSFRRKDLPVR